MFATLLGGLPRPPLPDGAPSEDLVAAAINDAVQKVERMTQEKMASVMGGMQLPPGMKMPF